MASSGMLRSVARVRTEVSEELRASFIRVTRIGELGTALAVTSDRRGCVGFVITSQHALVAIAFIDSCHPGEGGAKFLRNVGSYKSHTA
jgi:hypothetical protein